MNSRKVSIRIRKGGETGFLATQSKRVNRISKSDKRIWEIRWHGRGGQGAVTSAQILAEAAYYDGYQGVTSAPYFGAERRGAPVSATTRFSPETIRVYSEVETPDVVVVLDESLLKDGNVTSGLNQGGWLVVNSTRRPAEIGLGGGFCVATANATGIAQELGLVVAGVYVVNTPILGAFLRATGLLSLESVCQAIKGKFSAADADRNFRAVQLAFKKTLLK